MKTQILQLESHDDVISARDKMGWGQTGRILLIWPQRGRILGRRLDLVLLQRRGRELGIQLALVTRDPLARFYARSLGIHIFDSARQAQNVRWKRRRTTPGRGEAGTRRGGEAGTLPIPRAPQLPTFPAPSLPASLRLALFSLGLLAFLSVIAIFLPKAEISLTPATQIQEITLDVQGNTAAAGVNLAGMVPIRTVSVVVEGRDSLIPTGSVQIPEGVARGEVLFTNLTDKPVFVPAGTVVSPRGALVRFVSERDGQVPAGPARTLLLPVTALAPGSGSNLPAGRIQEIHGILGVSLTVSNPKPMTGGSDRPGLSPTPLDQVRLRNRLLTRLQESAQSEIQAALEPADLLLTPRPTLRRTLEETYEPKGAQPANQLSLTLRLEFQALVISGADLQTLTSAILDANAPKDYAPLPETLAIEHLTQPALDSEHDLELLFRARWQLRARRTIRAQISDAVVVNLLLGQSPARVQQHLSDFLPLAAAPRLILTPAWWPRLPLLPFRISVRQ